MLVANKADLNPEITDVELTEFVETHQLASYKKTSALSGDNVQETITELAT
jgi:hypothetical protein